MSDTGESETRTLSELRKKNEESKKNKDGMIEQRYNELTGKAKRTEW